MKIFRQCMSCPAVGGMVLLITLLFGDFMTGAAENLSPVAEERKQLGICSLEELDELNSAVPQDCKEAVALIPLTPPVSGAQADYQSSLIDTVCSLNCLPKVYELYSTCLEKSIADFYVNYCSMNTKGVRCGTYLLTNISSFSFDTGISCVRFGDDCPETCANRLGIIAEEYGCCFNSIWDNGAFSVYAELRDEKLWMDCGLTNPGYCPPAYVPDETTPPASPSGSTSCSISGSPSASTGFGVTFALLSILSLVHQE